MHQVSELDTLGYDRTETKRKLKGAEPGSETMWRCSWLLIAGLAAILPAYADADTACVPNGKSNTISVIDTDKLRVVKTIEVGQRPRRILVTEDNEHFPVIDVASLEVVRTIQVDEQPWGVFIAAP